MDISYERFDIHEYGKTKKHPEIAEYSDEYLDRGYGIVFENCAGRLIGYFIVLKDWILYSDSCTEYHGNLLAPLEVSEQFRGIGFGQILLEQAITKGNANMLFVEPCNDVAIHIYKKHGFSNTFDTITYNGKQYLIFRRKSSWVSETALTQSAGPLKRSATR